MLTKRDGKSYDTRKVKKYLPSSFVQKGGIMHREAKREQLDALLKEASQLRKAVRQGRNERSRARDNVQLSYA